uniref:C-type lectin domain-containing protein n=1 Tax=Terrapene triunguis TaxID=2587831 RepID=A0A674JB80_9SAUR
MGENAPRSVQLCSCNPPVADPGPLAAPCCSDGWVGYGGKCYYFSEAEGNWTYSRSNCSSLGASLAGINSEPEMVRETQMLYSSNRLALSGQTGSASPVWRGALLCHGLCLHYELGV